MTRLRRSLQDQRGFTLIEVMTAAFLLVVGLLGVLTMLDQANTTTSSTKAREQGVALQREIVEAARSVPFDEVAPTSIVSKVQQTQTLGDSNLTDPGWTIVRRGVTYTVTLGACSVDDPNDGTGTKDPAMYCPLGTATAQQCNDWLGLSGSVQGTAGALTAAAAAGVGVGSCGIDVNLDGTVDQLVAADVAANICITLLFTCNGTTDKNPDDYKRIVSLVRWDRGSGSRKAHQATTIPNPGLSAAPAVSGLTLSPLSPITLSTTASLAFTATTNRAAAGVSISIDGTPRADATGAGTAWAYTWPLGTVNIAAGASAGANEVLDGSYVVGAKAYDQYGQFGATRAQTVTINRRQPYAPTGFAGGRNGSVVDFEWAPNKERDLAGYRVYRSPNEGGNQVCTLTSKTTCQDTNPPSAGTLHYVLYAVDRRPSDGTLRDGDPSATITVTSSNDPPYAASNLVAATSGGNTTLTWSASPGDPNALLGGDKVDYYRIYRDGTAFANRYDRTGDASTLTWTDTNTGGTAHQYWVVAVDTQLAESTKLGPVTGA